MTALPDKKLERVEDEAAAWLVRLAEAPDDEILLAQFADWHAADDLNAGVWARTRRAYGYIGDAPVHHATHWQSYAVGRDTDRRLPTEWMADGPAVTPSQPQRARFGRRLTVGVAALAFAALMLITLVPDMMLRFEADVATKTAETRMLTLDDGSTIQLGPESAVSIDFAMGERRVTLIKGEVFFEVTPDAARPFRVAAGETTVSVLGTAFEVRIEEQAVAVSVRNGRVHVDDTSTTPPVREDLLAGDWVRIAAGSLAQKGRAAPDEVAAWLSGEIIARDHPAGRVVDALRPYYPGVIIMGSAAFAERRVSGIYSLRDPEATLRDLAVSHGATVRQISPWLLLVTGG